MSLMISGLYGFLAIAMGAYAQHGLQGSITPEQVHALDTALRYQLFHAVMICILSLAKESTWRIAQYTSLSISCWLFVIGYFLFLVLVFKHLFYSLNPISFNSHLMAVRH